MVLRESTIRMSNEANSAPRYVVNRVIEHDEGNFMYSYTTYSWIVTDTHTGRDVYRAGERDEENASGRKQIGVADMRIEDGHIVIHDHSGTVERVPLEQFMDEREKRRKQVEEYIRQRSLFGKKNA